jgi:ubiquinone/menaquinone biosynthesis C-methylase UbiE
VKLRWRPVQSTEDEWMDAPGGHPPEVIADNLNDLRRVNALLGGVRLTLRPLARLAAGVPPDRPLRVLDVATGGADIPRAVAAWARRHGRRLFIVASDVSPDFLAVTRRLYGDAGLVFVAADSRRLPFATGAFDVITWSLALHHVFRDGALDTLREFRRCARRGVVVNDIVRHWIGYVGAIIAVRCGSHNVLTRHDGPLSVLRAYTRREMAELAQEAGLRPIRWESFAVYRVALTAVPNQP